MKSLITPQEHNEWKRKEREAKERALRMTGVACPKCGTELEWDHQGLRATFGTTALMRTAICPVCALGVPLEA